MDKKYNVYIVEYKDGDSVTCIGKNMNDRQAEKRVMTGLMRCDRDRCFVTDEEVGSDRDKELQARSYLTL
jgi:hypothetical protein